MVMKGYDPHTNGGQYLEDLATGYWVSDALFTALELDIFEILDSYGTLGATVTELSTKLSCDPSALTRYLQLLIHLGLLGCYKDYYYNSMLAHDYLLKESPLYQGDSILWRKGLEVDWKTLKASLKVGGRVNFLPETISEEEMFIRRENYIKAMDNVAQLKSQECISFFPELKGKILDIGTGSGRMALAFLEKFKDTQGTLLDIEQILPHTEKIVSKTDLEPRIHYHPCNILDENWGLSETYDLIILSNIVHAYSEKEIKQVLKTVSQLLNENGILLVHDFFTEHFPVKASLSDVNMLLNTYNGKVFSYHWVIQELKNNALEVSPFIALKTDTGLIFSGKSSQALDTLHLSEVQKITYPIKALGFHSVMEISPESIVFSEFAKNKCRFGCRSYEKKHCKANDLEAEKAKALIKEASKILLLKGEPSTQDFQRKVLCAENLAFKAGFHKAFSFWAGPCSICKNCDLDQPCTNTKNRRPSMEGAGIDVFETVRNNGEIIHTLKEKGEYIKYYGLLLID